MNTNPANTSNSPSTNSDDSSSKQVAGNAHSHPDGLYNIKNIGTSLYIDINPDRDTVVGYTLNIHPHGKLHQQWSLTNSPLGTTLETVHPRLYASVPPTISDGSGLIGTPDGHLFVDIEPIIGTQFYIRVRKTDLYWQLVNDSLMTQATVGPKRNDNKDKWIFIPIL